MSVTIVQAENILTAYLKGELDHHNAPEIRESIDIEADRLHPEMIVLDFGEVTFMDSSGIGLVMGRYKLASSYGGKVSVRNASSQIRKVMKIAGLERLADIE
jgi:stage II sporulation protein AA (anti-sigma F factor antagonist)